MTLRTVAIVGVTGTQGDAVARALLQTHAYRVRGLTRNPTSAPANALKALGAEIVAADLDLGVSGLASAFKDAWAVYAYTVPGEKEVEHGKAIVDAALQSGVERIIWSSSVDSRKISNGKWILPVYDDKIEVQRYIAATRLRASFLNFGAFCENVTKFDWLTAAADGQSLTLTVPMFPDDVPTLWTWIGRDLGEAVRVILKDSVEADGQHVDGETFVVVRDVATFERARSLIEEVSGLPTTYHSLSKKELLSFDPHHGGAMSDHFQFWVEFPMMEIYNDIPNTTLVQLGAQFGTLEDWAREELPKVIQTLISNSKK